MKKPVNKGKRRLALYTLLVGGFAVSGIVLFTISQYQKAKYQASSVVLTGAQSQLNLLENEEMTDLVRDKIAWYTDIRDYFKVETEINSTAYKKASIPAYVLTTMALVSFGLCLKFEDIAKAKEDKE